MKAKDAPTLMFGKKKSVDAQSEESPTKEVIVSSPQKLQAASPIKEMLEVSPTPSIIERSPQLSVSKSALTSLKKSATESVTASAANASGKIVS